MRNSAGCQAGGDFFSATGTGNHNPELMSLVREGTPQGRRRAARLLHLPVIPLVHLRHRFEIADTLLELFFVTWGNNSKKW
jgi:hypothetical protein